MLTRRNLELFSFFRWKFAATCGRQTIWTRPGGTPYSRYWTITSGHIVQHISFKSQRGNSSLQCIPNAAIFCDHFTHTCSIEQIKGHPQTYVTTCYRIHRRAKCGMVGNSVTITPKVNKLTGVVFIPSCSPSQWVPLRPSWIQGDAASPIHTASEPGRIFFTNKESSLPWLCGS